MNELYDVAYFKWQPTDRDYVFQSDSPMTVKEMNGNDKFSYNS